MKLSRHALLDIRRRRPAVKLLPRLPLGRQPLRVSVLRPIGLRVMRPLEDAIAIVAALLHFSIGTRGQMLLPRQPADVARVGENPADEPFARRQSLPILPATGRPRISPGEKRRPTRRADRALTESVCQSDPLAQQPVDVRRADMWIAQRGDCVPTLLVGADPENVGRVGMWCSSAWYFSLGGRCSRGAFASSIHKKFTTEKPRHGEVNEAIRFGRSLALPC